MYMLENKDMSTVTLLDQKLPSSTKHLYPSLKDIYHGPTEDVLTCDGICHTPRNLCIAEIEQVAVKYASNSSIQHVHPVQVWLDMAKAVVWGATSSHQDPLSATNNPSSNPFSWSTPEGAMSAMTGKNHAQLSLPPAVYAPLSGVVSAGAFHPVWIEEALGFMQMQATGSSFDPTLVVPRATEPASRISKISAITGLEPARVSNLASAGLSGFFYLSLHRPEDMSGQARLIASFFNGLPYADELSVCDQGGAWSKIPNLAGPLLAAERLLNGPQPKLFEEALLSYHCCTIRVKTPSKDATSQSMEQLFLARFYDSTLPSFLDCFKSLDPVSVLPARIAAWGTLLSNDVFDYVSDGLSGRAANLCWAMGTVDGPIQCARLFRGCVLAVARSAYYAPGALFSLLLMELEYMYSSRYLYYTVPCPPGLPLDDTYIPVCHTDIPRPDVKAATGFRAALREAFALHPSTFQKVHNGVAISSYGISGTIMDSSSEVLPQWMGLAATPCAWDDVPDKFDMVSARGMHDILGCLDRAIYVDFPELYSAHLGWIIRQYDALVAAGRDNLGIGRYYSSHRIM